MDYLIGYKQKEKLRMTPEFLTKLIQAGSAIKIEVTDTKWENLEIPKITNLLP